MELVALVLPQDEILSAKMIEALKSFSAGRHRLEEVENSLGLMVINDSKATNTASTIAAIKSVAEQGKKNIVKKKL